jgi:hypothetical protein
MKVFLDTEFTGLVRNTTLISLAMVDEDGRSFYAEFDDYDAGQVTEWINHHVIARLEMIDAQEYSGESDGVFMVKGDRQFVKSKIEEWLYNYESVEMWADVLAYDWVLFCDLFGGSMFIPSQIFYAPFDLSTLFRVKAYINPVSKYDQDLNRFEFAGYDIEKQHHALHDARVMKICFEKLMK